jgi:hypothetical protein
LPFSASELFHGDYSGKSVGPRAGLLKSHSPWYRSHDRILLAYALGTSAEKARKCTATKPDAMAAQKKVAEENETTTSSEQNEGARTRAGAEES